jgi:hypothetical protein
VSSNVEHLGIVEVDEECARRERQQRGKREALDANR